MPRTYLDFDLLIEREGSGYRARVLDSPSGQAAVDFTLPFSDLEMDNFLLRVTRSLGDVRRNLRRLETPERQLIKGFGSKLFDAVFTAGVKDALQGSLNEAYRKNAGLRIRLRLTEAPELANVPWEFLHNPVANQFLSLNPETPLVRYLDLPVAGRPLAVTPPLRVLVMISSPSDFPQLDVAVEWDRLNASLHDLIERKVVTLTRLPSASLASFTRPLRLSQYHIFHFVGHGGFDEQSQDGALVLEDDEGRGRLVSGQDLGVMLAGHRSLRLVILNACEGARAAASDPFAGVAQTLIQQAIPAVVAMQFEITDEAAITFAHEFYGAVADGYPVDAAVAESRRAIYAQGNEFEWGTPVLYMRSPNGQLFRLTQAAITPDPDEDESDKQREQQERERAEREQQEREHQQEHERQERERAEHEQREEAERERAENEQRERAERERAEREQAERERAERRTVAGRLTAGYVYAFLALDAVLIIGAFGTWGPSGARGDATYSSFERAGLRLIGLQDPPNAGWFTSVGFVLLVLAAGLAWAAMGRRRLVVGLLGGTAVVCSVLFVFTFDARTGRRWFDLVGWGAWVVILTGIGIVIVSASSALRRRAPSDDPTTG